MRTAAPDRLARSEPFEVFTRPQRSWPARLLGLSVRRRAEITVTAAGSTAWHGLSAHLPTLAAGLVLGGAVLLVAIVAPARRYVHRRALAVLTRHRLRSVLVQRRVMNWTGNLPVLLWSRPTAVGERVWVLLRAGIDGIDIERVLPHIASGCFARDARITVARSMTALVLVDVVRRDPLTAVHTVRPTDHRRLRPVPTRKAA